MSTEEELAKLRRKLKIAKRKNQEVVHEDDGEGNWLISYADLMTLLFGFFVILSAFSTPNAQKVEELRKETSESMGGKYSNPYTALSDALKKNLKVLNVEDEISIIETLDGISIISQGTLFFESASSDLKPKAKELVSSITDVLSEKANELNIIVEGHTDNIPIQTRMFPSNWELSSARAGTVVRLLEEKGLKRDNLRPVGLADTEPLKPPQDGEAFNSTEQAKNRRIVIRISNRMEKRL